MCFWDRVPEWRWVHAWSISPTHADGYMQLFPLYILPLFDVYRYAIDCASRVLQLYASRPVIYSENESLNAISSDRMLYCLHFCLWLENCTTLLYRELKRYNFFNRNFCVLCRICIIAWDYSEGTLSFVLVNRVNLSYNLEYSAKIPVTKVIKIKIAH